MGVDIPWNLVGISPDAREAAREAAQREGLSVGEWLTRWIYLSAADEPQRGRDKDWLNASLIELGKRLDQVEGRLEADPTRDTLRRMKLGLSSIAEDLARASEHSVEKVTALATDLNGLRDSVADLRGNAMRATASLDHRLTDVAELVEKGLQRLDARQSADVQKLSGGLDQLSNQLGKVQDETLEGSAALEQRVGQITTLMQRGFERLDDRQALAAKSFGGELEELTAQLAAVRGDVRNGADAIEQRVSELRSHVEALDQRHDGSAQSLAAQVDNLTQAIASARSDAAAAMSALEGRIAQVQRDSGERTANHAGRIQALADDLSSMSERLEKRSGDTAASLQEFDSRLSDASASLAAAQDEFHTAHGALAQRHADLDMRLGDSERKLSDDIQGLQARLDAAYREAYDTSGTLGQRIDEVHQHIAQAADGFDARLAQHGQHSEERVAGLEAGLVALSETLRQDIARLDSSHAETAQALNGHLREVADRMDGVEANAAAAAAHVDQRIADLAAGHAERHQQLADQMHAHQDSVLQHLGIIEQHVAQATTDHIAPLETAQHGLAARLDEIQARNASAQDVLEQQWRDAHTAIGNLDQRHGGANQILARQLENLATRLGDDVAHTSDSVAALDRRVAELSADDAARRAQDEHNAEERAAILARLEDRLSAFEAKLNEPAPQVDAVDHTASLETMLKVFGERLDAAEAAQQRGLAELKASLLNDVMAAVTAKFEQASAAHPLDAAPAAESAPHLFAPASDETLEHDVQPFAPPEAHVEAAPHDSEPAHEAVPEPAFHVFAPLAEAVVDETPEAAETVHAFGAPEQAESAEPIDAAPHLFAPAAETAEEFAVPSFAPPVEDAPQHAVAAPVAEAARPDFFAPDSVTPFFAPPADDQHGMAPVAADPEAPQLAVAEPSESVTTPFASLLEDQAPHEAVVLSEHDVLHADPFQATVDEIGVLVNEAAQAEPANDETLLPPPVVEAMAADETAAVQALTEHADALPPLVEDQGAAMAAIPEEELPPISYLDKARQSAQSIGPVAAVEQGTALRIGQRNVKLTYALVAGIAAFAAVAIGSGVVLRKSGNTAHADVAPLPVHPTRVASLAPSVKHAPAPVFTGRGPAPIEGHLEQPKTAAEMLARVDSLSSIATLAAAGNADAQLILGLHYLGDDGSPADDAQAAKWLEKAAVQNEPVAQYRLATLYAAGHGVTVDPTKAFHYYSAAAEAGNRKAMYNLAVAYVQGNGTPKNLPEAARWFSRAAELGLIDAQFDLAVLYERGLGVPQSLLNAYGWYAAAAKEGDTEAKTRVDALATQLSADDRAAAEKASHDQKTFPMDPHANVPRWPGPRT